LKREVEDSLWIRCSPCAALDSRTVCILMKSEGGDFWNSVTEGAYAAGEEFGYKVICRGPEGEDASFLPKQREILNMMLAEHPVGIGVATIADGFTDLLKYACEQKIPAVQYDSGLYREDLAEITAFPDNPLRSNVVADTYQNASLAAGGKYDGVKFAGYDDGEKVREWMNSDSKSPLLGSVSQNPYQMGYLTVKTIIDIGEGKDVPETIVVPGDWISP